MGYLKDFIFLIGGRSTEYDASIHSYRSFYYTIKGSPLLVHFKGLVYIDRTGKIYWSIHLVQPNESALQQCAMVSWSDLVTILQEKNAYCFSLLHGNEGEDGAFQGLAEVLDIPGSFGSTFSASITMSKWASSYCAPHLTTDTLQFPKTFLIHAQTAKTTLNKWLEDQNIQSFIIKPNSMGASILTEVFDRTMLDAAILLSQEILCYAPNVIVQEFIEGDEYTCGCIRKESDILGLPVILAKSSSGFLGHKAKHSDGWIKTTFCEDTDKTAKAIQRISVDLFKGFEMKNMARFDYIVCPVKSKIYFLECNSIPGFGHGSAFPQMLEQTDLTILDFLTQCLKNEHYLKKYTKSYPYEIKH